MEWRRSIHGVFLSRVAPTVAELIGMEPPTDAQGKAINSAIK